MSLSLSKNNALIAMLLLCGGHALTGHTGARNVRAEEPSSRNASNSDWPMFRGGPSANGVAHGALPKELAVLWTFEGTEPITSTAAIVRNSVYFGDDDGVLFSIRLTDGKVQWRYRTGESIRSSPTVDHGVVYFGDAAGVFHAVDAKTGKRRWRYETKGEIISSANVGSDRVVFGSYDGTLYCLAKRDGRLLWSFPTEGRIHGSPALVDGKVIVAGCDEHLHVVRLDDGKALSSLVLGSVSGSSPAVTGDMAYVGTYGHKVLGIDWVKGAIRWTFADPEREFPFLASAAVSNGVVVVTGRDKRIRGLDAETGRQLWEVPTRGRNDASPVILGDRIYQPSSDGTLYVLKLTTGEVLWRFDAGAPMSASPAIGSGRLIIGTEDGALFCLGRREKREP